jgi:hypothetical protein
MFGKNFGVLVGDILHNFFAQLFVQLFCTTGLPCVAQKGILEQRKRSVWYPCLCSYNQQHNKAAKKQKHLTSALRSERDCLIRLDLPPSGIKP